MNIDQTRVLAARWVVPITGDPIHRGWVRLAGEEVVEVGQGKPPSRAVDLGDVGILPGLVNAHTHLEFSDCDKPIGQNGIGLHDWIGDVISARGMTTTQQKSQAILDGIRESSDAGVRLIGEITSPPCEYDSAGSGIELVTFAEVLGLSEERAEDRLNAAKAHNESHPNGGWSPHSVYSTTPDLVDRCIRHAKEGNRPVAMHVAESPAERELIDSGSGPLAESLRKLGIWRDGLYPWDSCGFSGLIEKLAGAARALLIHGNDLNDDEMERIARHKNLTVVYCPRTHAFFGYGSHPVDRLIRQGIRVALGTDSRASNPDLNLWQEVQHLLHHRTDLKPPDVIKMATANGADALGRYDVGRISVGASPGLGAVSTNASSLDELWQDLADGNYMRVEDHGHAKIL